MDMFGRPIAARKSGSTFEGQATAPDGRPLYLRFGTWPKNERSMITEAMPSVHELGVSVYRAGYDATSGSYFIAPDEDLRMDTAYEAYMQYSSRPVFLVTGEEIGLGGAGEPVLRRVKVVAYAVTVRSRAAPVAPPRLVPVSKAVWHALEALRWEGATMCIYVDHL